jgi:choline dehydrogenase-like flavoprotein
MIAMSYDAVVVGSGAGGGVVAAELAKHGQSVLLVERGRDLTFEQIGRDPLRNQRMSRYGHNAGPDARHVRTHGASSLPILPWDPRYHANAATLGGGTRVYGAQAWRFHPADFRMASEYGIPEGSSLADWPIGYAEIEPWYATAEHAIGVCGDQESMIHLPDGRAPYPMPPLPESVAARIHRAGAARLGWPTVPVPLAINSIPRDGRPACQRCPFCVGFACPVDAKNGSVNAVLRQAMETGNITLSTDTVATRLETTGNRVSSVILVRDGAQFQATAPKVILAAGAIESARLLLVSGIGGNAVGRHLQGHVYTGAIGRFDDDIWDGRGPGVTTATCRWSHGNQGIVGGGMLADEFVPLPIVTWKRLRPKWVPDHGPEATRWMVENYRRVAEIKGPVQDIPSPHARVTLSAVRDAWGVPVAHLGGATHSETIRTAAFLHEKAREWLAASGAVEIWGDPPRTAFLSGGQHQAGTCRMGDDPDQSVVDRDQKVHGMENLWVGDASVHVTNGGFNPVLTVFALSFRLARHLTTV